MARTTISPQEMERFAHALLTAQERGTIPEVEFQRLHRTFVALDSSGAPWSVGLRSHRWSRLEGRSWTTATPPESLTLEDDMVTTLRAIEKRLEAPTPEPAPPHSFAPPPAPPMAAAPPAPRPYPAARPVVAPLPPLPAPTPIERAHRSDPLPFASDASARGDEGPLALSLGLTAAFAAGAQFAHRPAGWLVAGVFALVTVRLLLHKRAPASPRRR